VVSRFLWKIYGGASGTLSASQLAVGDDDVELRDLRIRFHCSGRRFDHASLGNPLAPTCVEPLSALVIPASLERLCPKCAQLRRTRDHSSALGRTINR